MIFWFYFFYLNNACQCDLVEMKQKTNSTHSFIIAFLFKKFLLVSEGNGFWIWISNMPKNKEAQHSNNDDDFNDHQSNSLSFVVVGLNISVNYVEICHICIFYKKITLWIISGQNLKWRLEKINNSLIKKNNSKYWKTSVRDYFQ